MKITEKQIKNSVEFHGHECPGLWIGIRAAELCIKKIGVHTPENPLVCVVETDMCGVDAIQTLTGCTFGKGNLIHKDYGKNAFTFFNRKTGEGFRALLKPDIADEDRRERDFLSKKIGAGEASDNDKKRVETLRNKMKKKLMAAKLRELFKETEPGFAMPRPARILESKICAGCKEHAMESRIRLLGGKTFCMPCFGKLEQKL